MQKNISNYVLLFLTVFVLFPLQGMEKERIKNPCTICLNEMNDSSVPTITTTCGHSFDCACFKKWVDRGNKTCPICRAKYNKFDFSKHVVMFEATECKDIVTPHGTFVWRPGYFKNEAELPKNNVITSDSKYLRSYLTILKKPNTWKPLIIPTISLALPWVFNQDISRKSLIAKGCMSASIYCLLTPYSTRPEFRWFSFERLKRIIGYTLALGGYIHMVKPIALKSCVSQAVIIGTVVELSCMIAEWDKTREGKQFPYSKSIDIKGAVPVGIGLLTFIDYKIKLRKVE